MAVFEGLCLTHGAVAWDGPRLTENTATWDGQHLTQNDAASSEAVVRPNCRHVLDLECDCLEAAEPGHSRLRSHLTQCLMDCTHP